MIDTTLWTVDPFAHSGDEHLSLLIGHPVAVMRARLTLEVNEPIRPDALQAERVPVRLGALAQWQDGLLAYFVDDDYRTLHLPDPAAAGFARPIGPGRGFLQNPTRTSDYYEHFATDIGANAVEGASPIKHDFVDTSDVILMRPGQTIVLTLLIEPHSVVHATSGLVPRKAIGMRREWVTDGLAQIAPTFRFGPVLVDPKRIRMPVASELHGTWSWCHRVDATSWQEDAVVNSLGDARTAARSGRRPGRLAQAVARETGERERDMSDEERELEGEGGEAEGPEALQTQHEVAGAGVDIQGNAWRRGIAQIDRVPFGGEGWWEPIGPEPLHVLGDQIFQGIGPNSGAVVDVAIDPTPDRRVMYVATSSGGVWKTVNGGQTWKPLTDLLPSMQVAAIAIDPGDPEVLYAGTGTLFEGGGGIPKARGIFKSLDGGETWMHQYGDEDSTELLTSGVNRIVCIAPNTLFVATDRGLYLSIDGGRNFGGSEPAFDDGSLILNADPGVKLDVLFSAGQFISALIPDVAATTLLRVEDADGLPTQITCTNHGFQTDDRVYIGGVEPSVTANGSWIVDRVDDNHFTLRNSPGAGAHATRGWVMGPARPRTLTITGATTPTGGKPVVVTSATHELVSGDVVAVHSVRGARGVNGVWTITVLDDDRFELDGSHGRETYQAGTGKIDAPPRRAQFTITAADNTASGIEITAPGHTLRSGDSVRVTGLPGVTGVDRQRRVQLVAGQPDKIRLAGKKMNAPYAGGGGAEAPAVWNHVLYAVANSANDPLGGLLRLTLTSDGLVRSRDLLRGAPGVPSSFGRVVVAQSMLPRADAKLPDGRTLFCAVQSGGGKKGLLRALLISSDHGRTWTSRKANITPRLINNETDQSEYDLTVGVDPLDPVRVYIAFKQLFTSGDGGATWPVANPITGGGTDHAFINTNARTASSFQLHWDHHELVFAPPPHWDWTTTAQAAPVTPAPVFFGTDGGVARSDDAGASFVTLNDTIATNLSVAFDIGRGQVSARRTAACRTPASRDCAPSTRRATGSAARTATAMRPRSIPPMPAAYSASPTAAW